MAADEIILFYPPLGGEVAIEEMAPPNGGLLVNESMVPSRELSGVDGGPSKLTVETSDEDIEKVVIRGVRVVGFADLGYQRAAPFMTGRVGALKDVVAVFLLPAVEAVVGS